MRKDGDLEEGMIVRRGIVCLKGLLAVFLYISGRRRGGCRMEDELARVALVRFGYNSGICSETFYLFGTVYCGLAHTLELGGST